MFDLQEDLDYFLQSIFLGKYLFATQMESGVLYDFAVLSKAKRQSFRR